MWGCEGNSLKKFDPQSERTIVYPLGETVDISDGQVIRLVCEDHTGGVWCLILGNQGGAQVYRFDESRWRFNRYEVAADPRVSADVNWIYEDRSGAFWFGNQENGLVKRIASGDGQPPRLTEQFVHYQHIPGDPQSLSSNRI